MAGKGLADFLGSGKALLYRLSVWSYFPVWGDGLLEMVEQVKPHKVNAIMNNLKIIKTVKMGLVEFYRFSEVECDGEVLCIG